MMAAMQVTLKAEFHVDVMEGEGVWVGKQPMAP